MQRFKYQRLFSYLYTTALLSCFWISHAGFAQTPAESASFEFGGLVGRLLPNQIDGVTEIIGQAGGQMGFGLGPGAALEFVAMGGNGEGQEWAQASTSLRMDVNIEEMVGMVFLGADATYFQGLGKDKKLFGGGHLGGGMMANISSTLWFRVDMKFNINPGTSLLIRGGFIFRL